MNDNRGLILEDLASPSINVHNLCLQLLLLLLLFLARSLALRMKLFQLIISHRHILLTYASTHCLLPTCRCQQSLQENSHNKLTSRTFLTLEQTNLLVGVLNPYKWIQFNLLVGKDFPRILGILEPEVEFFAIFIQLFRWSAGGATNCYCIC